ncbi:MAG: NrtA/SsuA/CpmA family ABC transporter substrate-binding protein [Fusobacteriaceae bacterium]|jgi:sulfonate transport system substrate-binding protein|nr:NrtA/SsuA/CpmA family ABC transporter substrate-binding protein [Fusobacteriaceae bacterium]
MKKILFVLTTLFISIFAFSKDKVTITYVKSPLNVPSIVEKEKGIFKSNFEKISFEVDYSDLTTGPEQTNALASGDIKFLNAVGATSAILASSNGSDIKIIDVYSRSPKAFTLFSKDKNIKSPSDLKGKKIAGPKGTILHELLIAYLAKDGLKESDVEFIQMGLPNARAALVGGSVDLALLAGPVAYTTIKDGYNIVTTGEGLVDATIVTATSARYYKSNPEAVEKFIDARKETLEYIKNNYEEIIAITAKETDLPIDAVKEMYEMYDFDNTIKESDIDSMKKTTKFMIDNKMIEKDVDIQALILKK